MKRIMTSMLLLLVLTLSVHPSIVMHFCESELYSLNVNAISSDIMCCSTNAETNDNAPLQVVDFDKSCCSFTNLEVVTDNFIPNSSESVNAPTIASNILGWIVSNNLVNVSATDLSSNIQLNDISHGFFLKTLDFLSLVCIYRI